MQVFLALSLVFAAVWFTVLRPKSSAEPVAATPAPAVTTPAATSVAGALENDIDKARSTAADASAKVHEREGLTGADDTAATTPATTPKRRRPAATTPATTPKPTTPAGTTPRPTTPAAAKAKADAAKVPASQRRADAVIEDIQKDLAARKAVVVLIYSPSGDEDRDLKTIVTKKISKRGGKVRTYLIKVDEVGRYDGLLAGLSISQTPSTIVIAPDNQAKVLGGLVSTVRIDRLTSSALQSAPTAGKK